MPPFTAKEVTRFLIWIAVLLVAAGAIVWMIWQAPGRKAVPTKGTTASFVGLLVPGGGLDPPTTFAGLRI